MITDTENHPSWLYPLHSSELMETAAKNASEAVAQKDFELAARFFAEAAYQAKRASMEAPKGRARRR